jgi:hypothetical protein
MSGKENRPATGSARNGTPAALRASRKADGPPPSRRSSINSTRTSSPAARRPDARSSVARSAPYNLPVSWISNSMRISRPNMPTLSVIAVTFNEARHVAGLWRALEALERPGDVRIEGILVDGGSGDGTAARAREAGFTKVVELPGASIPVCRNRGLREATGEWIAFFDGDCAPAADWLQQALPLFRRDEAILMGWPAEPPEPMTWVQAAWLFHWQKKNPHLEEYAGVSAVKTEGFRLVTTRNMALHRKALESHRSIQ